MKLAIFICAHDGISCHYSGVGTATSGYIKAIPTLRQWLQQDGVTVKCYCITNKYLSSIYSYNEQLVTDNTRICRDTGGDVLFCLNNSNGLYQYGDISSWVAASASAATLIDNILSAELFDRVVVLGVDTPFAFTPIYLGKQLFQPSLKYQGVWIPHSTSLIHERGNFDTKRLAWEMQAVHEINSSDNLYISYLNSYMYDHMQIEYGTHKDKLIPLLNGIYLPSVPYFSHSEIMSTLEEHNIPTDKPIIFSFGRGALYKGFDVYLNALRYLQDLPVHFILQVAFYSQNDPLLSYLKELAAPLSNISVLFQLSYILPRQIMQWKNTELVAVLSRNEPGAFIPAEIRIYGQAIALVSDRDGLPCQIENGIDGFITNIDSPEIVANKISEIISLDPTRKSLIRAAGKSRVLTEYDIVKNFSQGITALLNRLG